jgi:GNAT superfamily N-acetyltransferase
VSAVLVRPFARADRDQVTELVNAHAAAVVPNVSVSVSGLMSHLEREPDEYIVDPWVAERLTLVAEQRRRIVAAAHLLRYADEERVRPAFRGTGEIRWLLYWPDAPFWPDSGHSGDELAAACLARLARWSVRAVLAEGTLPVPGVYGVPEQWPHVREVYARAGFRQEGATETVLLARIGDLPRPGDLPPSDLTARRTLGVNGTRISALRGGDVVGYVEVESLDRTPRTQRTAGWADIGNLEVDAGVRGTGIGTWLLAQAADWLDLGGVTRTLGYADDSADDVPLAGFLAARGFRVLTRTVRGLTFRPG